MIDPLDEAFRFGRGVFETLLVRDGRALLGEEHLASMNEAAVALGLDNGKIVPGHPPGPHGIWRWALTPRQFLTTWVDGVEETGSVELGLSRLRVCSTSWEARFKTMSHLLQIQAREEASSGWDVLLNENGVMAGATMANLFWARAGRLFTPSLSCGCRNGAVRRWISAQYPGLEEAGAATHALDQADEIFLTNSRIGIAPVTRWLGRPLGEGPRTRELREKYQRMICGADGIGSDHTRP